MALHISGINIFFLHENVLYLLIPLSLFHGRKILLVETKYQPKLVQIAKIL